MNQRAFNLFTALISFTLIILTVLLVNSMISAETNTKDIISDIEQQSRLESVAQLTRADAIQIFNFGIRKQIEEWLLRGNTFTPATRNVWEDWDLVKKEFAEGKFGGGCFSQDESGTCVQTNGAQFAFETANHLIALFSGLGFSFGNFKVDIENTENFKPVLTELVNVSVQQGDFFQVIDCDGTIDGCKTGTFYVNLRTSKLDDATYESLPRLVFTDAATGRQLKDIILPRNDIRIYVPLRVFKALAWARNAAHSPDAIKNERINLSGDFGLLSPRIHNEIETMKLGMCDYGSCRPRNSPYGIDVSNLLGKNPNATDDVACPGAKSLFPAINLPPAAVEAGFKGTAFNYKADDPVDTQNKLKETVRDRGCEIVSAALSETDSSDAGFAIISGNQNATKCPYLDEAIIETTPVESKKIDVGTPGTAQPANLLGVNPNVNQPFGNSSASCPFTGASNVDNISPGLFFEAGELKLPENRTLSCQGIQGAQATAFCAGVERTILTIAFKEKDDTYMVNKKLHDSPNSAYRIRIVDNFVAFNPNYMVGEPLPGNGCVLGFATEVGCFADNGWSCVTKLSGIGDDIALRTPQGCYPA